MSRSRCPLSGLEYLVELREQGFQGLDQRQRGILRVATGAGAAREFGEVMHLDRTDVAGSALQGVGDFAHQRPVFGHDRGAQAARVGTMAVHEYAEQATVERDTSAHAGQRGPRVEAVDREGRLWGWGSHHLGQLGRVQGRDADAAFHVRPRPIRPGIGIAQIDGGMHFSVALSVHGEVFAWGWNGMGQLATQATSQTAAAQRIAPLRHVSRVSVGQGHVLALSDQGVHAWGDNRTAACGMPSASAVMTRPNRISLA